MPVSPTSTIDYYTKCEQTVNSIIHNSPKTAHVTVFIGNVITNIINGNCENTTTWGFIQNPTFNRFCYDK
jgi:hypothetical protein